MIRILLFACALIAASAPLHASYTLSLGQYSRKEAEDLHQQMMLRGYPVYLLYGESCEVRLGSYGSQDEAGLIAEKIKTEDKVVARIVEEDEWDQAQFNWNGDEGSREVEPVTSQEYADPRAQRIISMGLDLFGHPYKYGGTRVGKGIDCSYFVQIIFKELGINLPRTSGEQFMAGKPVDREELKVGDLVFFQKTYRVRKRKKGGKRQGTVTRINHVGIYIGNGEFIHATINVKHVTISRLDEKYFTQRFAGARRILQE